MSRFTQHLERRPSGHWTKAIVLGLSLSLVSCNKSQSPETGSNSPAAGPKTFATVEDASAALVAATKAEDRNALLVIFGPEAADIISSGDPAQEKKTLENFTAAYQVMNRWRKQTDGSEVLLTGADNDPFPIPLKRNGGGQWYFDTAAGKDELLSRRIGRNELATIDVMSALTDAQAEYFLQRHDGVRQYAQKFISGEGKQDGLYWKSPEGQPRSPLGPLLAFASTEGFTPEQGKQQPFHGYFYRMLTNQGAAAKGGARDYLVNGKMTGGFAVLAYPESYGNSGIMTFIVNQSGVIYQKDLGKNTSESAKAVTDFNPDSSWAPVPE